MYIISISIVLTRVVTPPALSLGYGWSVRWRERWGFPTASAFELHRFARTPALEENDPPLRQDVTSLGPIQIRSL